VIQTPAQQVQGPEFKPQYWHKREREREKERERERERERETNCLIPEKRWATIELGI
jgi:hypothetical protein